VSVLAFDIGGTKVAAGVVSPEGKILFTMREPVVQSQGPEGLVQQIVALADRLHTQISFERVGLAAAGPLNSHTGELLDPTNFRTHGKSWGKVPFVYLLRQERPQWSWGLDNDAAAAALAELKWGNHGAVQNLMIITLGTGVGVGAIVNGEIARSRPGFHPEVSHIPLNAWDQDIPCGCGQFGCIEAYLAGSHMVRRLSHQWKRPDLTGEELIERLKHPSDQDGLILDQYAEWMAQALNIYAIIYGPEVVGLAGGFSDIWSLVEERVIRRLSQLLSRRREGVDLMPKVTISSLRHDLGILGGAVVAKRC